VEYKYYCSLEELFSGCHKKFNVERQLESGKDKKLFEFDVHPGWKRGTKVTFEHDGGMVEGYQEMADLIFVLEEKPHSKFTRDGNDLKMKHSISLSQALLGGKINIEGIDSKSIPVDLTPVVKPGKRVRINEEGMPVRKKGQPQTRGDLFVEFDVQFPSTLSQKQIDLIKQANI
jgi:DnaJ-class molecular chaperone